jgi:thiamine-monophosphate kinase|tara:strand:- start:3145 stop:4125 length:981 start_codon:yes stop_codon:yes gene_type:complete
MDLSQLGERKIIKIFEKIYGDCDKAVLGMGDDSCIIEQDENHYLVVSTDLLSRKTHFPLEMSPQNIGKYAVNACLSDIASMGANPLGLLFSYGLPKNTEENFIKGLAQGIAKACTDHDTCVLGGDTKEQDELLITGIALGKVRKDRVLRRSGAKVHDLICTTGIIGSSAAGFYAMIKELDVPPKFIKAAFEPQARIKEGIAINKYATSCADISDGLAYTIHEIVKSSKVGFRIYEKDIPCEEELGEISELAGINLDELLLYNGGEYELLFTLPKKNLADVERKMEQLQTSFSVIGEIVKNGNKLIRVDGSDENLELRGYEAFKSNF